MTAMAMQKLATVLLNEGYVVKKIEDEMSGFYEKYTGRIIITIRSVEEEEADAEDARFRKEREREALRGNTQSQSQIQKEEIPL